MRHQASSHRRIVKSRTNRSPGCVVRIELGDGRCAYGRQLTGVNVEFYDYTSEPDKEINLFEIVAEPIAFTIMVMDYAFRRTGRWTLLDVVTLTEEEAAKIHRYAKPGPTRRRVSICYSDPVSGAYGERPATIDSCRDLEIAAIWDPEHVEDRLRDHLDGRPNKWVESLRIKS